MTTDPERSPQRQHRACKTCGSKTSSELDGAVQVFRCTGCNRITEELLLESTAIVLPFASTETYGLEANDVDATLKKTLSEMSNDDLQKLHKKLHEKVSRQSRKQEGVKRPVLKDAFLWSSIACYPLFAATARCISGDSADFETFIDEDVVAGDFLTKSQFRREGSLHKEEAISEVEEEQEEDADAAAVNENSTLDIRYRLSFFVQIRFLCQYFGFSDDVAKDGYRVMNRVTRAISLRNRRVDALAVACFLQALSDRGVAAPSVDQVAAACQIDKENLEKELRDCITSICTQLGITNEVQALTLHMAEKTIQMHVCPRRNSISVAAGLVYLSTWMEGVKKTQEDITRVVDVTQVTLRKVKNELKRKLKSLLPPGYEPRVSVTDTRSREGTVESSERSTASDHNGRGSYRGGQRPYQALPQASTSNVYYPYTAGPGQLHAMFSNTRRNPTWALPQYVNMMMHMQSQGAPRSMQVNPVQWHPPPPQSDMGQGHVQKRS